jgi:CDP-diacylglycerol--serine O-phosphatidyltransferase
MSVAALIPNLLTTLALCSGLAALHFALQPNWEKAMGALVLAGIFDFLDGGAARLLRASSQFGAVLDSLSDFLAFGVAPALILHQWMLAAQGPLGLAAVMTHALCAGLRLARFTAAIPKEKDKATAPSVFFVGMPTPASALAVLIPVMLSQSEALRYTLPAWAVASWTFAIGVLMISRWPMFSLKRLRVSRHALAPMLLGVGLVVVALVSDIWLTLSILAALYVLSAPLAWHVRRRQRMATTAPQAGPAPVV